MTLPKIKSSNREVIVYDRGKLLRLSAEAVAGVFLIAFALWLTRANLWIPICTSSLLIACWISRAARVRIGALRVILLERELWLMREGQVTTRIPYEEIATYDFGGNKKPYWLRIGVNSSDAGLEIPAQHFVPRKEFAERSFIRMVGPRLKPHANKAEMSPSCGGLKGYLLDNFFEPPVVTMTNSVTYRYRFPAELTSYLSPTNFSLFTIFAYFIIVLACFLRNSSANDPILWVLTLTFALTELRRAGARSTLKNSLDDRFVLTPDGSLQVLHKGRTKILRNPALADDWRGKLLLFDAPVIRYGIGPTAYYFDPRFIEPDV